MFFKSIFIQKPLKKKSEREIEAGLAQGGKKNKKNRNWG